MDIIVKNYQSPNINEKEILRYAGMKESTPEISKILKDCLAEINGKLNYDVCYLKTPITVSEDIDFKHFKVNSSALKKNLSGYTSAVVFVATVGIENLAHFFKEGCAVLKLTVDGCKANVGNFVKLLKLFHHQVANYVGGNFLLERVVKLLFDVVDNFVNLRH